MCWSPIKHLATTMAISPLVFYCQKPGSGFLFTRVINESDSTTTVFEAPTFALYCSSQVVIMDGWIDRKNFIIPSGAPFGKFRLTGLFMTCQKE